MDCLAETGSPLALTAAMIALVIVVSGAVAVAWSIRRRSGASAIAVLGLLLIGGFAVGIGDASPASAADCPSPTTTATTTATATPTPTPVSVQTLTGSWSGLVTDDSVEPYLLTTTITDDGTTASAVVTYAIVPECDTTWTQTARTATVITFTENVTDPVACAVDGTLTLTFDSSLAWLHYEYFYSPSYYPDYPYFPQATLTPVP